MPYPGGGQRQTLTLLMTAMSRPSLLLLDEHTAAPDPRHAELIMDLTVMRVTHNLNHARKFNSRLPMTDSGEIIPDIDAAEGAS